MYQMCWRLIIASRFAENQIFILICIKTKAAFGLFFLFYNALMRKIASNQTKWCRHVGGKTIHFILKLYS